jgi:uncharacterized cupin superfamily protein
MALCELTTAGARSAPEWQPHDDAALHTGHGGCAMTETPIALFAADASPRTRATNYPEPFASRMAGRIKRPLGDLFGLGNFGVNLTCLRPGAVSALHHVHSRQDELIYVLEGEPTLFTDAGATQLRPGMVAGFPANGTAHHLENRTDRDCLFLEIGDRTPGDEGRYPADDIQAVMGDDGKWRFTHKDGSAY